MKRFNLFVSLLVLGSIGFLVALLAPLHTAVAHSSYYWTAHACKDWFCVADYLGPQTEPEHSHCAIQTTGHPTLPIVVLVRSTCAKCGAQSEDVALDTFNGPNASAAAFADFSDRLLKEPTRLPVYAALDDGTFAVAYYRVPLLQFPRAARAGR